METLWFVIVALMLAAYVLLDGFDIGAGIAHLFVARTDEERRIVLRSIGPVWDGNEVWLLAAGGTLYFAFPVLYASAFSGFYLPLIMVVWLLMLRAIGIEFRSHIRNQVWSNFFDTVFAGASMLLAIFYGAALGNVLRGVPLGGDGYFFLPLWTNFRPGPEPGILDWYTVIAGLIALVALLVHGSLYIAAKSANDLNRRARTAVRFAWPVLVVLTVISLFATVAVRPELLDNYKHWPVALVIPVVVLGSLAALAYYHRRGEEKRAFVASSAYLATMLVGAVFAVYPQVLPAIEPRYSLTITNAAAAPYGLKIGLVWWSLGMVLAIGYFTFIYRLFKGKVRAEDLATHEGY
ncbi:MAG TPA: cytochrome d ubiquinol oxidase subunit II [Terriglobales bacterium]|nr:cytochrome d ubiquinol oxidase subunit II [Terriglobales bacterium]